MIKEFTFDTDYVPISPADAKLLADSHVEWQEAVNRLVRNGVAQQDTALSAETKAKLAKMGAPLQACIAKMRGSFLASILLY
jgi:hypothetical protein